ncbi:MAG: 2,3-bisphosphoglycerate-independent phosphoglycerate mutase [Thermodesulfobacteriota bacterium]|nr:2,3-bisphosphoglycerate-independent phosphoglycerate mutase [Thermodesulfobacteriota bacterium]
MTDLSLRPLPGYKAFSGPLLTVIMDGVGIGPADESDGVHMAYTPVLDALMEGKLVTKLKAHGTAVGLPTDGDMGNSEVGHNALGSGRIFAQGAKLVNEALHSGVLFQGASWEEVRQRTESGGTLHFIGLISDGNVHSHVEQLGLMLDQSLKDGIQKVRVHGLLDGRDVGPKSALEYFGPLEEKLIAMSQGDKDYCMASGGGRMIVTMDRYEADWAIVEKGWQAHVLGIGRGFTSACEAIGTYYDEDPTLIDQYMDSFVVERDGKPVGTIEDGDAVILFNFRGDRAIELSRAFDEQDFNAFNRQRRPDVFFAGIMQYDGDAMIPKHYLVEPPAINRTLGEYLCAAGITSYAISETQKFGHVTYFWNGNKSGYIDESLEKYVEIESDRITFDLRPWMKASEITDKVIEAIQSNRYKNLRLNFANGDMVGHTGVPVSVRIAVETVDLMLRRLLPVLEKAGGVAVITADHGNADCMWTEKNGQRTAMVAHTKNPVPFIIKDFSGCNTFTLQNVKNAGLANVAATVLNLLGFLAPEDYQPSLLKLK